MAHFKPFAHSQLRDQVVPVSVSFVVSLVSSDDIEQGGDKVNREDIVNG